eukprot:m.340672 g.340672  ORF g.340672 m.340672 type:complete len:161 (-) comp19449_c0_seq1:151-633(-)
MNMRNRLFLALVAVCTALVDGMWNCDKQSHKCYQSDAGHFESEKECALFCAGKEEPVIEEFDGFSPGTQILIVFSFGMVIPYIVIGSIINVAVYQRRGYGIFPHVDFWTEFGACIVEGMRFSCYVCAGIRTPNQDEYRPLLRDTDKNKELELQKSYNTHI